MSVQEKTSGTALGLLLVAGGVALFLCSGVAWIGWQNFSARRAGRAVYEAREEQLRQEAMDRQIVEEILADPAATDPATDPATVPPPTDPAGATAAPTAAVGGEPQILGSLDRSLVDAVIKRNMAQIRYCYQRELTKNPSLAGKITVKFVVAKDGSVSSAEIKLTTMQSSAVESCVVSRIQRLQFPAPKGGGIAIISYPFVFSPG